MNQGKKRISYAGIGARATPSDVTGLMFNIGSELGKAGWLLRSGHAHGADWAFESGAQKENGPCEIFIPWEGFNGAYLQDGFLMPSSWEAAMFEAALIHPAWDSCKQGAQRLHGRNMCQILGKDLNDPVDFVVCWTPRGRVQGGTATAIRVANKYKVPVFNLGMEGELNSFIDYVQYLEKEHAAN